MSFLGHALPLFFITLASWLHLVHSDDWMSCEGFIKFPVKLDTQTPLALDYSKLEVQLVNEKGQVKDRSQISPDGYYALPVYDTGNFKLKVHGPLGWTFEPKEVKVISRVGGQRTCANGDINFEFLGFGLSGTVESMSGAGCEKPAEGLAGLQVTLTSEDGQQRTATTDQTGQYSFDRLLPGRYTLTTAHERSIPVQELVSFPTQANTSYTAKWMFAKAGLSVEITNDNVVLQQSLKLLGANLLGHVVTGEEPVQGCQIALHAAGTNKLLVTTTTDANGVFHFMTMPCGRYVLVPSYKGLELAPAQLEISVGGTDYILPSPFRLLGFTLTGKVVTPDGTGIGGATVIMRDEKTGASHSVVTDSTGMYLVDQLSTATYSLTTTLDHASFEPLTGIAVNPSMPALPHIIAKAFDICGRIEVDAGFDIKRKVMLNSATHKAIEVFADAKGHFCAMVPLGEYSVSVEVSNSEHKSGLAFRPSIRNVVVSSHPVLDVTFAQVLLQVQGAVQCIAGQCPPEAVIHLKPVGRSGGHQQQSLVAAGAFVFTHVLPGQYVVSLSLESFCWDKKEAAIEVSDADVVVPAFVQTGFRMQYALDQDELMVQLELLDGAVPDQPMLKLWKAERTVCLPRPGVYRMKPQSCFQFEKDEYQFDTAAPTVLEFFVKGYEMSGTISIPHSAEEVVDEAIDVLVHIQVSPKTPVKGSSSPISKKAGDGLKVLNAKLLKKDAVSSEYSYSFFSTLDEEVIITPKAANYVFRPQSRTIRTPTNRCPEPIPSFTARGGSYLTGTVSPAIAGVHVSLGDGEEPLTAVTDEKGVYRIGPLYGDHPTQVNLQKKGYIFTPQAGSTTDFLAERLSAIVVRALDADTKQPIGGVFLSLSGKGYRNNTATQPDGEQEFVNLPPGTFFLRAVLKEYVFEPPTQTITLQQGQLVEVEAFGRRMAFSCMGTVVALNGRPEPGIGVEAQGPNGEFEETTTNEQGQFRLRGLKPGVTYTIRIQPGTLSSEPLFRIPQVEYASPEEITITLTENDAEGLQFIAFRAKGTFDVSGTVDCDAQWVDHLQVQLVDPTTGTVYHSSPLSPTKYFEISNIKPALHSLAYGLRISHSLPSKYVTEGTDLKVLPFREGYLLPRVEAALTFQAKEKEVPDEVHSNPFLALMFVATVAAGWYYRAEIMEALGPRPSERPGKRS